MKIRKKLPVIFLVIMFAAMIVFVGTSLVDHYQAKNEIKERQAEIQIKHEEIKARVSALRAGEEA